MGPRVSVTSLNYPFNHFLLFSVHLVVGEMVICFEDFPIVEILLIASLWCCLTHFFILSPTFLVNSLDVESFRVKPGVLNN